MMTPFISLPVPKCPVSNCHHVVSVVVIVHHFSHKLLDNTFVSNHVNSDHVSSFSCLDV